jgi:hypothetical protein
VVVASPRPQLTGPQVRTDALYDRFDSNNISAGDLGGISSDTASFPRYKGYLGTPSGVFKALDAASGSGTDAAMRTALIACALVFWTLSVGYAMTVPARRGCSGPPPRSGS